LAGPLEAVDLSAKATFLVPPTQVLLKESSSWKAVRAGKEKKRKRVRDSFLSQVLGADQRDSLLYII
jgi:hypothetical protein